MRKFAHETSVSQKHALIGEELTDFTEGQHVMTVDGFPGRITAVSFGPFQVTEDYEVTLDNGLGGGTYSVAQLRPFNDGWTAARVEAAEVIASIPVEASTEHTADIDYPELGTILNDRLPNENIKVYAARNLDQMGEDPAVADDDSEQLNQDDQAEDPEPNDTKSPGADDATDDPDPSVSEGEEVPQVDPPSACSFCGHDQFEDPQMTGRGVRMRCAQCHGTMKSWGGQWEPEFPNSSQNNASEMWDYRSGGPGGVVQTPGANYKASGLIVNYFVDKIYDRLKKLQEDQNQWWLPQLPETTHDVQGPAQYNLVTPHTGSASDLDEEWGFHYTATWMDVQAKARKIRKDGGVKIIASSTLGVVGEINGDTAVYESQLNYVVGSKRVADWACGCKWASYSWGRSKPFKKFEGRLCSHALALQYEAGARGMFGKDIQPDVKLPEWQKPHQPVTVQYDKTNDRNLNRRTVPPGNMKRTFSALTLDSDGIYEDPSIFDLAHPPIYAAVKNACDHSAPLIDTIEMLAGFNIDREDAKSMVLEAFLSSTEGAGWSVPTTGDENAPTALLGAFTGSSSVNEILYDQNADKRDLSDHDETAEERKLHEKHKTNDAREHAPHWGWGSPYGAALMTCPQCTGSGCGHCAGLGQVPVQDESTATQSPTDSTPDQTTDAGSAIGTDGVSASLKTADYSSADPLVGVDDQNYNAPTPHSHSGNPASTGWATSQDPGDWGRSLISNDFGVTFDASLHTAATHPEGEFDGPTVSGVALKAADTGRVLMIQRSMKHDDDPAKGTWEFPGGHHEEGDQTSLHAGIREWKEETGQPFPSGGHVSHVWRSGPYQGHVVVIPSEDHVDFSKGRSEDNPDDPDLDDHEQAAWWDPDHAKKNPALREELKKISPFDSIKKAARYLTLDDAYSAAREAGIFTEDQARESLRQLVIEQDRHFALLETDDLTLEAVLSGTGTLNAEPEPALPSTDGIVDDTTGFAVHQPEEDASSIAAGNTVDGPHVPSSDISTMGSSRQTEAEIIAEFQRSAGAKALAEDVPELQQKIAMKEFNFAEQQDLINEGNDGTRARNFNDLKIAGTHYEMIPEDEDNSLYFL